MLLLTLHNEGMNREKGLIQHLIVELFLFSVSIIIIIMIEPFQLIPTKDFLKYVFIDSLGDRSKREHTKQVGSQRERTAIMHFFLSGSATTQPSDKGFNKKRNHNGMNYDERFSSHFLFSSKFKCKIIIRA